MNNVNNNSEFKFVQSELVFGKSSLTNENNN